MHDRHCLPCTLSTTHLRMRAVQYLQPPRAAASKASHLLYGLQLRAKKEAMEAALAAREDAGSAAAGEDGWDAASEASGLSAVSGMSVYTAAQSGAAPSASAGGSAYAPSTVGGRRPDRQRKQKVNAPARPGIATCVVVLA